MKKIIPLLFLILIFFNLSAQNTTGIITYKKVKIKKTFTEDKKERLGEEKFKKFSKIEEDMDKAYESLNFILKYNNNKALFKAKDFMESPNSRFLKFSLGVEGKGIYYNTPNKRVRKMNTFGEDFLIHYPKNFTVWTLMSENKKSGNYISYKAVATERVKTAKGFIEYKIVAWYTPEINIPYGPLGYSGLPGLILELEKNDIKYYVTKIELNPKKLVKINEPLKGKKITKEDYNNLAINAMGSYKKIRG